MKFSCHTCQQRLEVEDTQSPGVLQCPACGQGLSSLAAVQGAGPGSPLQETASVEKSSRPSRSLRVLPLILILVLLCAVTAGSGFFAGKASKDKTGKLSEATLVELKVFPDAIQLTDQNDAQGVVVQALYSDGLSRDVTTNASWQVLNPEVARLDKGTLHPSGNGETKLKIDYRGKTTLVPLVVRGAKIERPISFKLDVMPVFMKAGCNSGSCHGSSRGKDGFRLSLFGYDPDGDYHRLTREMIGRRINSALPNESLILEKATGQVPHTGGERFNPQSPLYQPIHRWLEAGAPKDSTNVARVVAVEMSPRQIVLEDAGSAHKLNVRASYSDGTDRDVTSLAVFISNNESSVKVSDLGSVITSQRGEAFVTARFDTFTSGAQVLVVPRGLKFHFPDLPEHNYIDGLVYAKLKKLRIQPSDLCDDATFLRRVYLDIIGLLPAPKAVEEFVADPTSNKRIEVVDQLLQRKEFADLWVMKWSELLQIRSSNNDQVSPKTALFYYSWLQEKMAQNVPIDQVVQELLTTSGTTFKKPAANYYQIEKDTLKTAENVAQVFLGMRIQCAQCHNHPFDRWTMDDYYGFSAFFSQVGRKTGEDPRETVIYDKPDGEVKHPVGGRVMKPKFLAGDVPEITLETRRAVLAKWLTSPENPFFGRNMANIIWAHFFGKGIIDPVDDVRITNPPSNPELLESLASHLVQYGYDFRKLVRDICTSRTYQLSTRANPSNALDDRNFARASIRRLRAEVLLDCINQITESNDKFQGLPRGARAVQIADGNSTTYFLTTFGRATRNSVCSCEVKTEPNLSQALHLINGSTSQGKIQDGALVRKMLKEKKTSQEIINELYLRCYARKPTAAEIEALGKYLKDGEPAEEVLVDLFWALLNSKEFLFNH